MSARNRSIARSCNASQLAWFLSRPVQRPIAVGMGDTRQRSANTLIPYTMPRAKITLPTLLAQLPAYGQGSLVQPASWAERFPNSFYKITRTNLRVKLVDGAGSAQHLGRNGALGVTSGDAKGKARQEEEDADMDAFGDDMEIGEVSTEAHSSSEASSTSAVDLTGKKAHGQAWGVLFWNGK